MISDDAINYSILNRLSFSEFRGKYGSSKQNLFCRLRNYLVFNLSVPANLAIQFIRDYENGYIGNIHNIVSLTRNFHHYFFDTDVYWETLYMLEDIKLTAYNFAEMNSAEIKDSVATALAASVMSEYYSGL